MCARCGIGTYWEIFIVRKFSGFTFNDENQTGKFFSSANKWSDFIMSIGRND